MNLTVNNIEESRSHLGERKKIRPVSLIAKVNYSYITNNKNANHLEQFLQKTGKIFQTDKHVNAK